MCYLTYTSASPPDGQDFNLPLLLLCFPTKQLIQYINMIKSDDLPQSHGTSFTSDGGEKFPWIPGEDFEYDDKAGHGTHVAGSAAGATLNTPAEPVTCGNGTTLSCVGGCIDENLSVTDDDLVSSYYDYADIDRLCPTFGCDATGDEKCLGDDLIATLTNNGGVAQGAKVAVFDAFFGNVGGMDFVGNDLWKPCAEADCKVHSNSWGGDLECELTAMDLLYDDYMYQARFTGDHLD